MSTAPVVPSEIPPSPTENPSPADKPRLARGVSRRLCPQCAQWFDGPRLKVYCSTKCGVAWRKVHPRRDPVLAAFDGMAPEPLGQWFERVALKAHERAVAEYETRQCTRNLRQFLAEREPNDSGTPQDRLIVADDTCSHGIPLLLKEIAKRVSGLCPLCKGPRPGRERSAWNGLLAAGNLSLSRGMIIAEKRALLAGLFQENTGPENREFYGDDAWQDHSSYGFAPNGLEPSGAEGEVVRADAEGKFSGIENEGPRPTKVPGKVSTLFRGSLRSVAKRLGVSHEQVRKLRFKVDEILGPDVETARYVLGYSDEEWAEFQLNRHLALARARSWQEDEQAPTPR